MFFFTRNGVKNVEMHVNKLLWGNVYISIIFLEFYETKKITEIGQQIVETEMAKISLNTPKISENCVSGKSDKTKMQFHLVFIKKYEYN